MQLNDRIADTFKIQQKFANCKENIPPTHTHTHTHTHTQERTAITKKKRQSNVSWEKNDKKIIERHFRWGNIQPKLVSEREERQETYSSEVKALCFGYDCQQNTLEFSYFKW